MRLGPVRSQPVHEVARRLDEQGCKQAKSRQTDDSELLAVRRRRRDCELAARLTDRAHPNPNADPVEVALGNQVLRLVRRSQKHFEKPRRKRSFPRTDSDDGQRRPRIRDLLRDVRSVQRTGADPQRQAESGNADGARQRLRSAALGPNIPHRRRQNANAGRQFVESKVQKHVGRSETNLQR